MRTLDLSELDHLNSRNDRMSLDPLPNRDRSMHPLVLRDLISDHIRALKHMNTYLSPSTELDAAISRLEEEYAKLLGRNLIELSESNVKPAVLDLRRELKKLSKEKDPDLSYRSIDSIMRRICKQHDCKPRALHDAFVSTLGATPDDWVREQIRK